MELTGQPWADALIVAGSVVAAGALLAKPVRAVWRVCHSLGRFLDDWHGRPDLKQLGAMARLEAIEYELRPNSGRSLRDRVDLIERHTRPSDPSL